MIRRLVVLAAVALAALSIVASVGARDSETGLRAPTAAVPLPDGGFLVTDLYDCTVKRGGGVDGALTSFAGVSGQCNTTGDGGAATSAHLNLPTTAVPVQDGTLIGTFGFGFDCRVRKVATDGTISTVAGTGTCNPENGDGGPATAANISFISIVPFHAPGAAVDTPGSGFLMAGGCAVRKVDGAGTITTVAGTLTCPSNGESLSTVACTTGLCLAAGGGGLTNASTTPSVRSSWRVRPSGPDDDAYNDVSCPSASFCALAEIDGTLLVSTNPDADTPTWSRKPGVTPSGTSLNAVSCVSSSLCLAGDYKGTVRISTDPTAGTPTWTPYTLDGNVYSIAGISCPSTALCVAAGGSGKVFSSTAPATATPAWKTKTVVASTLSGISCPTTTLCVAIGFNGNAYVSTNPASGDTSTWTPTSSPVSASALQGISCPTTTLCVAVDDQKHVYTTTNPAAGTWSAAQTLGGFANGVSCASATQCVAVGNGNRFVATDPVNGPWQQTNAFSPELDNVPATSQPLVAAYSAVPTADGGFLIAEQGANRIRKVLGGTVTIVAGNGTAGFSGDGGAATAAQLNAPSSAVPTTDGGFLIADTGNCAIRKVTTGGQISTVAGTGGTCGTDGAGGPATAAQLSSPTAAVPFAAGDYLIGGLGTGSGTNAPLPRVKTDGTVVSAVGPGGAVASPSPSPAPSASPSPSPGASASPSPTPSASASPVPTVTLGPIPTCTLSSGPAKVKSALKPVARCTRAGAVTVKAKVTLKQGRKKPKTVTLSGKGAAKANAPVTLSVKLSKTVTKAIKKGAKASVALTLNAGGLTVKASIKRLKLKR